MEIKANTRKFSLPYITKGEKVIDRMETIVKKFDVKTLIKSTKKKNCDRTQIPLTTYGIYRIICTYGSVYVETIKRSVDTMIKEHTAHCRLGNTDKSAIANHTLNNANHRIRFDDSQVLATTLSFDDIRYREAIEIKHSFNRTGESMRINRTWIPALASIKTAKLRMIASKEIKPHLLVQYNQ